MQHSVLSQSTGSVADAVSDTPTVGSEVRCLPWKGGVSQPLGDTHIGVTGDTRVGVTGDTSIGANGHIRIGVAGDKRIGVTGDTVTGLMGDTVTGLMGDTLTGVTGDALVGVTGDALVDITSDALIGATIIIRGVAAAGGKGVEQQVMPGCNGRKAGACNTEKRSRRQLQMYALRYVCATLVCAHEPCLSPLACSPAFLPASPPSRRHH